MAFQKLEPWGHDMDNWRMGNVAAAIYNVHRTKKTKALKPQDFMPGQNGVKKAQSVAEQIGILRNIAD